MNTKVKKANVKKQAFDMPINEHQKEMDKIANKMALLFEKKITASKFAKWVVIAKDNLDTRDDLMWGLGHEILPALIEAKTPQDRIKFLKKELPTSFEYYEFANRSLFQLGENFLKSFKGLFFGAWQIEEFMSIYLPLLSICEMLEDYEFHKDELEKETKKAA
ncbi:hypothetical protein FW778_06270 [Ginsengibacter hankyongi]|uniref:Uncharacterized protein n=1 Tax=Ginsengibacter hankyongi TaxID=2607284 RepID=A0A5J5IMT1_9BACT|nr:hypothetical protein [Ginsengibacter hankyongi]KAA9041623.1 hypothetical protein FW778_06270 [Ginsengibacter hankyongi]